MHVLNMFLDSPKCTVAGPAKGERCQFPFQHDGETHEKCIKGGRGRGNRPWCPTKLDSRGKILGDKNWGFCGKCEKEGSAKTNLKQEFQCGFDKQARTADGGNSYVKWSNNEVPYQFDSSFTSVDRETFKKAAQQISEVSCIKFTEKSAPQYLWVRRDCACGGSCFQGGYTDGLGAASPRQLVIGSPCLSPNSQSMVGFVAHEIMHALGFIHGQKRPDRDGHLKINVGNIVGGSGAQAQFTRCDSCQTTNTAYDCMSIMHYRAYFFARGPCSPSNPSGCSMTALNPSTCDLFTANSVMTKTDIDVLNNIYGCSGGGGGGDDGGDGGGNRKSCKGSCGQKSPDGCYCDELCEKYKDCCPDKKDVCNPLTCSNNCGKKVSFNGKSCYCDSVCERYGDCCDDKSTHC